MNTTENDSILESKIRTTLSDEIIEVYTTPDDVIHISLNVALAHVDTLPSEKWITTWMEEFSGSDPIPKIRPYPIKYS